MEPLLCGAGRGVGRAQAGLCLPRGAGSTLGRRSACTLPGWACTPRCSSLRPWWGSSSSCTDVPPSTRTSPGRRAPHPSSWHSAPREAAAAGSSAERGRPFRAQTPWEARSRPEEDVPERPTPSRPWEGFSPALSFQSLCDENIRCLPVSSGKGTNHRAWAQPPGPSLLGSSCPCPRGSGTWRRGRPRSLSSELTFPLPSPDGHVRHGELVEEGRGPRGGLASCRGVSLPTWQPEHESSGGSLEAASQCARSLSRPFRLFPRLANTEPEGTVLHARDEPLPPSATLPGSPAGPPFHELAVPRGKS